MLIEVNPAFWGRPFRSPTLPGGHYPDWLLALSCTVRPLKPSPRFVHPWGLYMTRYNVEHFTTEPALVNSRPKLGVVFDLDDTLYLERDYVKSGFRAVAKTAVKHTGTSADEAFNFLWNEFTAGVRGSSFNRPVRALPPNSLNG